MTKSGYAEINVMLPDGSSTNYSEKADYEGKTTMTKTAQEPLAYVELMMGVTEPTKQYANVKVEVRLGLHVEVEERDDAYDFEKAWIEGKINMIIAEVQESME